MRQAGLKATMAKKFIVTTDSKHELLIAENLLNREFGATEANTKWASGYPCCTGDHRRRESAGILCSISRRGNGWENAPVESFFGTFKQELVDRCDHENGARSPCRTQSKSRSRSDDRGNSGRG
jgi:transposase InsO family protein